MNYFTIKSLIARHRLLWANKAFTISAIVGVIFLVGSFFVNYSALKYVVKAEGNSTTDILLDNLPVVNTDIIFSEGAFSFIFLLLFLFILEPKIIPFTFKSIALFVCIRSGFVIMTHLAPPLGHIAVDFDRFRYFSSGADLFFSGHTGLPFLMGLLFWENKHLRSFFISCSVIAGVAVILGHLHYTIDVFSAFFITYGIYKIARKFFPKDRKLFLDGLHTNEDIKSI